MSLLSRRDMLAGLGALAFSPGLARNAGASVDTPTLIVILLRGGMDGLSALVPVGEADFFRYRPDVVSETSRPLLDGLFSLHPNLAGLQTLYDSGQLAIFPSVATSYRGRSHRDAIRILDGSAGEVSINLSGWIGRAAAILPGEKRPSLIATGSRLPLCLLGSCSPVQAGPEELSDLEERAHFLAGAQPYAAFMGEELCAFADRSGLDVRHDETLAEAANRHFVATFEKAVASLGRELETVSGSRIGVIEFAGWDTHHDQGAMAGRVAMLLAALDRGITHLRERCEANWQRTAIVVLSEFGRTVAMNSTGGTDHGTGTVAFLAGGSVRGGRLVGDWPGLALQQLQDGHGLRPTLDVRSVLKGVLTTQFGLSRRELDTLVFFESSAAAPLHDLFRI
jgi:uncharacterized protein (DUF1501 family)